MKPASGEPGDGQMYIVMACYEGEILKDKIEQGPLKLEEAIDIAIQIAKRRTNKMQTCVLRLENIVISN